MELRREEAHRWAPARTSRTALFESRRCGVRAPSHQLVSSFFFILFLRRSLQTCPTCDPQGHPLPLPQRTDASGPTGRSHLRRGRPSDTHAGLPRQPSLVCRTVLPATAMSRSTHESAAVGKGDRRPESRSAGRSIARPRGWRAVLEAGWLRPPAPGGARGGLGDRQGMRPSEGARGSARMGDAHDPSSLDEREGGNAMATSVFGGSASRTE